MKMAKFAMVPLNECVEEMFIGPFGSSLKSECFVDEKEAFCMVYEQKHAIQKTMDVETRYINESKYKELQRFNVKSGDILVSCRGTIGETYIVPENAPLGVMHPSVMKIRLKEGIYDKYYFNKLLKSRLKKHEAEANGSGIKMAISATELGKELFPVPTIEEQIKIKQELSLVETLIIKRKKELEELDNLIKSRFVEMFGDKGENPNRYNEDTLGNLYKFQYGKGNNIPEDKGEYPCYGSNGIVGHHTEFNSEDAPIIGHIGAYAGIVNWGEGKHYVTYNGVICKLKTDRINPIYGFYLLQQQDFNRVATKGGGQPFVSYGDLEAPIVVVPPIDVQNDYATFANQVTKLKFEVQKSLDETQILMDSLMQEYFG